MLRYINHGIKEANLKPHPPVFVSGKYRVGFLATKDIKAGEELLYDYGQQPKAPSWLRRKPQKLVDDVRFSMKKIFKLLQTLLLLGNWAKCKYTHP